MQGVHTRRMENEIYRCKKSVFYGKPEHFVGGNSMGTIGYKEQFNLRHYNILDDALARRVAIAKGIPIRGTIGLLLDAKRAGHAKAVKPFIDGLQERGFCLAQQTREDVLKLAGES